MLCAKLPYNTQYIHHKGKVYCAYCGKELIEDNTTDHYEIVEQYYHCDCEDAKKEISIKQEIQKVTKEYDNKIYELKKSIPKRKYKSEKTVTCELKLID